MFDIEISIIQDKYTIYIVFNYRFSMSAEITPEQVNTCISIVFSSSPPTWTISTVCGVSLPLRSSCRTGTPPSRISTVSGSLSTRVCSVPPCRPCSREPGSSTGLSSSSLTTLRAGSWLLTCSCTRSSIWTLSRPLVPGCSDIYQLLSSQTNPQGLRQFFEKFSY